MNCNNILPINNRVPCDNNRKNLIKELKILAHDCKDVDLTVFLEKVKDDPELSITLYPIDNTNELIAQWNYVCEISSRFYKTKTFNIRVE